MLVDARPRVRRKAVELLEDVACDARGAWLERAQRDEDPQVAAAAALVSAAAQARPERTSFELYESEMGDGLEESDLAWEWEYEIKVCQGASVPEVAHVVWTRGEDDRAAKRIALMKAFLGREPESDAVAVIVDKRLVTQYTRAPRSSAEVAQWRDGGRPRYRE